jgi:hypothetical protein
VIAAEDFREFRVNRDVVFRLAGFRTERTDGYRRRAGSGSGVRLERLDFLEGIFQNPSHD